MPWVDVIWTDENRAHVEAHGLTEDDVERVIRDPEDEDESRSSGRIIAFGETRDGRKIAVVYELCDELTAYPVTAYAVE